MDLGQLVRPAHLVGLDQPWVNRPTRSDRAGQSTARSLLPSLACSCATRPPRAIADEPRPAPSVPAAAASAKRCAPTPFITGPRRFVSRHSNRSPSSFYGDDARTSTTTVDALPPARLRTAASMPRHSEAPRRPAGAAGCGGAVHRAAVPRLLRLLMVAVATASRLRRWFMVTGAINRCSTPFTSHSLSQSLGCSLN